MVEFHSKLTVFHSFWKIRISTKDLCSSFFVKKVHRKVTQQRSLISWSKQITTRASHAKDWTHFWTCLTFTHKKTLKLIILHFFISVIKTIVLWVYKPVNICIHRYAYVGTCVCLCKYMYVYTHTRCCILAYMFLCSCAVRKTNTYRHTCTCTQRVFKSKIEPFLFNHVIHTFLSCHLCIFNTSHYHLSLTPNICY